jgi:hypothetical protein
MPIRENDFFIAADGRVTAPSPSEGLFVTNGTAAGTSEAIPLSTATAPTMLSNAAALTYSTLFIADGTLYATNPVTGLPSVIAQFSTAAATPQTASLGAVAVFTATTSSGALGLFRTDSTAAGTYQITPAGTGTNFNPTLIGRIGNAEIVSGTESNGTGALWATDGTNANTVALAVAPSNSYQALGIQNGQLIIAVQNSAGTITGLIYTNGTVTGTSALVPVSANVTSGTVLASGALLLGGPGGLFVSTGAGTPLSQISNLFDPSVGGGNLSGTAGNFVQAGGVAYFTVDTIYYFGVSDVTLWTSDGTAAGTHIIPNGSGTSPFTDGTDISHLTAFGNNVLFGALDPGGSSNTGGLWITNGTTAGTDEIAPGINVENIVVNGNSAVVTGTAGTYVTNGTAAGTTLISSATPGYMDGLIADTSRISVSGTHTQYLLSPTASGGLAISDRIPNRDGSAVDPTTRVVAFTDGTGITDPTGNAEAVARLYQAAFNTAPDIGGLTTDTEALDAGTVTLEQIAQGAATSPEFINGYGALSNTAFVTQIYQNALGRAPDSGGLNADVAALNAGVSRGTILIDIGESFEATLYSQNLAGDADNGLVYRLYEAIDARAPDIGGEQAYSAALASGQTVQQVAAAMLAGSEYATKFGTPDNTTFVTELYQNLLQRAPDAGGLASYVNDLATGTSRAAAVAAFVTGDEGKLVTSAATHDGWVFLPS